MKRTYNGVLNTSNIGQTVKLNGWASKVRDFGGLVFIDLRDRYGITQIVVKPENEFYEVATKVKSEYVLEVVGTVVKRESINPNIPTGEIEIDTTELKIINTAETPAIYIKDDLDSLEETRLKYRYLDLRRPVMQNFMITRHKTLQIVRNYLSDNDFLDLETPILTQSTPEGARDFLVPSRIHKGHFYALPQSPQIFKQLFMISGFDRYYQVAKCFRDEDLRSDRQLEFCQIDMEMSFVTESDVHRIAEGLLSKIFKEIKGIDVKVPFDRITYKDALNLYGSDKPDRRFEMLINNITDITRNSEFTLFKDSDAVKCIVAKGLANSYSRKDIEKLERLAKTFRAKGLAFVKVENGEFTGGIAKFINTEFKLYSETLNLVDGDIVFFVADKEKVCNEALGQVRLEIARNNDLINKEIFDLHWVVDFPLFEYDEEAKRYVATNHPFTAPNEATKEYLLTDPSKCIANAYDAVCNGYELGSGSLRIFDQEMQADMFKVLGFTEEDIKEQFGFFVNALKYGTPPHAGMALGVERIVMLLTDTTNIRDVVAFPKTNSAQCLLTEAPGVVSDAQLEELSINVRS